VIVIILIALSPEMIKACNDAGSGFAVASADATEAVDLRSIELVVVGMHCESCRHAVRSALLSIDSVVGARVDLDSSVATVLLHETPVNPAKREQVRVKLIEAIREAGFDATVPDSVNRFAGE
jgi:copper chaperone